MSTKPKFEDYQNELEEKCNEIVDECLRYKEYEEETMQDFSQEITSKITSELHSLEYGLKYICSSIIFKKGDTEANFASNCLWTRETDGLIKISKENDTITCFVTVFCLGP